MSFAEAYLEKVSLDPNIDRISPSSSLSLIVAIPACDEPGLLQTLDCLDKCISPGGDVEIIIALNSAESASVDVISRNRTSSKEIAEFAKQKARPEFRILHTNTEGIRTKDAGAGYARKIAMDHALSRFSKIDRREGIIISLDADTLCDENYFISIENHFQSNPGSNACSIYFEHPLKGNEFQANVYKGICEYELHMRYYVQGIRYAGHPHAFHTVGSAFCIRAETYASQGGMSRRPAGEDFYFLQKVIPLGNFTELNTTRVIPSPRPSGRVAFGTGPVVNQFHTGRIRHLESYNPRVFYDLKEFFTSVPLLYKENEEELKSRFKSWPESIQTNLKDEFFERLEEIRSNSAGKEAFIKRFYRWFNMFRTLKYINSAHSGYYPRIPVREGAEEFLNYVGTKIQPGCNANELLILLRKTQREKTA